MKKFELKPLRGRRWKAGPAVASAPAQMWVTNEIRDFAEFWPRSNRLGEAICYAFQCADILELHCETFVPARNADPWFVAIVNEKGDPLALFPFMIEHSRHISTLRFMDGALSDYNAPVLFPPAQEWNAETIRKIWRGLQQRLPFDIAVFEKVPAHIGEITNPVTLLTMSPQGQSGHFLGLSGTWNEMSARFPRRKELERKSRRLSRRGKIAFEIAETPDQYDVLIAVLIRQKQQRDLDAHGGNDTLGLPGFRSYLEAARRLVYPSGPVALFGLKVNDTVVAAHWGYIVGSRFSSLIPSFEGGEWYSYSPGFLLADKMLEWCLAKGLSIFDYGWGDEPYKREYCDVSTLLYRAEIPSTIRGRFYLEIRYMKQQLAKTRPWALARAIKERCRK
jgi:CelD/BcsL family acetyltransferase involved in cellulose biosynthesis